MSLDTNPVFIQPPLIGICSPAVEAAGGLCVARVYLVCKRMAVCSGPLTSPSCPHTLFNIFKFVISELAYSRDCVPYFYSE